MMAISAMTVMAMMAAMMMAMAEMTAEMTVIATVIPGTFEVDSPIQKKTVRMSWPVLSASEIFTAD
jgi:hypothetical protein